MMSAPARDACLFCNYVGPRSDFAKHLVAAHDHGLRSEKRITELQQERDRVAERAANLEGIIRSALGEVGDFPPRPDDWPRSPYYWRTWLRRQLVKVR